MSSFQKYLEKIKKNKNFFNESTQSDSDVDFLKEKFGDEFRTSVLCLLQKYYPPQAVEIMKKLGKIVPLRECVLVYEKYGIKDDKAKENTNSNKPSAGYSSDFAKIKTKIDNFAEKYNKNKYELNYLKEIFGVQKNEKMKNALSASNNYSSSSSSSSSKNKKDKAKNKEMNYQSKSSKSLLLSDDGSSSKTKKKEKKMEMPSASKSPEMGMIFSSENKVKVKEIIAKIHKNKNFTPNNNEEKLLLAIYSVYFGKKKDSIKDVIKEIKDEIDSLGETFEAQLNSTNPIDIFVKKLEDNKPKNMNKPISMIRQEQLQQRKKELA
jgi:hypothetical protein